jgi:hypothetical protein
VTPKGVIDPRRRSMREGGRVMTVACGGGEYELDRQTDCGQAALLLMAPELDLAASCGSGSGSCEGL